jgi:hypothetical protein
VPTFEAELEFAYSATPESDCSALLGVPEGFAKLPCSMAYDLKGSRFTDE